MREALLREQIDIKPFGCAECSCRPFADTIDGEDSRFFERTGKISAGRMAHMMIAEDHLVIGDAQLSLDHILDPELFLEPAYRRFTPYLPRAREGLQC